MIRRARGVLVGALALVAPFRPVPGEAQTGPRVVDVRLSADTVQLGDPFELAFTVRLGAGQVAFLPDSLEGEGFEPLGPVTWTVVETPGVRELRVGYPMIALDVGQIPIPDFEVFTGQALDAVAAGVAGPGDVLGSWEGFRRAPADAGSAMPATVPEQRLWVATLLSVDDIGAVIAPRPPADVAGGDVDWPASLLLLVFAGTLLGVGAVSLRDWRVAATRVPSPDPRARALAALDALLVAGQHRAGAVKAFFTSSSEIVREYVELFDNGWSRALTSSELMGRFGSRTRDPDTEVLVAEMERAERVKFAGDRPGPSDAELHAHALRRWVESSTPPSREEDEP